MILEILCHSMNLASIYSDSSMGMYFNASYHYIRTDIYNRVDKINMNNPKIVSPEKTGLKPFQSVNALKQLKNREIDDLHIEH